MSFTLHSAGGIELPHAPFRTEYNQGQTEWRTPDGLYAMRKQEVMRYLMGIANMQAKHTSFDPVKDSLPDDVTMQIEEIGHPERWQALGECAVHDLARNGFDEPMAEVIPFPSIPASRSQPAAETAQGWAQA